MIYVLTNEYVLDNGENGLEVSLFENLDDAKKLMNILIKNAKKDFESVDSEIEKDDASFSIWESGYYNAKHITITILEREVL